MRSTRMLPEPVCALTAPSTLPIVWLPDPLLRVDLRVRRHDQLVGDGDVAVVRIVARVAEANDVAGLHDRRRRFDATHALRRLDAVAPRAARRSGR